MRTSFQAKFEDFEFEGDYFDGFITIDAEPFGWDPTDVRIFAGRNASVLIPAPQFLAGIIREHFTARASWLEKVDQEHAEHFSQPTPRRPRLVPAWVE